MAGLGKSLLLNASFEPLCVVSVRRAVVLVLKEKAEIVAPQRRRVPLRARRIPVPTVIRLVHFVRVPYRDRVPALAPGACSPATATAASTATAAAENIDHVVPRSRGGAHTWDNVVASCRACNARKEDRLLHEAGLRLRRQPRRTPRRPLARRHGGLLDPAWERYLPTARHPHRRPRLT